MMVMPSNNCSGLVHYLAGRFHGQIGWLMGPEGFKEPRRWLPYAIDNGKFSVWKKKNQWDEQRFFDLLDRCVFSKYKPLWVTVPDEVGDCRVTESLWYYYEEKLRRYCWPLAYVVQDGCEPRHVPKAADIVFVGGTTEWKWHNAGRFCAEFPRVHVGRVNWVDKLEYCERIGAESCDGSGFFRGGLDSIQSEQLQEFLAGRRRHEEQLQLA
jgi:hypothetical protein